QSALGAARGANARIITDLNGESTAPDTLRERRAGLGLSQDGIIERLGLTDYTDRGKVSDFERGVREPDWLTLKLYAEAAGVSLDDLRDDNLGLPAKSPAAKRA